MQVNITREEYESGDYDEEYASLADYYFNSRPLAKEIIIYAETVKIIEEKCKRLFKKGTDVYHARDDVPAFVEFKKVDGVEVETSRAYYKNGKLHREGKPAFINKDQKSCWYEDNRLHRKFGPAITFANGGKEYWYKGTCYTEYNYNQLMVREDAIGFYTNLLGQAVISVATNWTTKVAVVTFNSGVTKNFVVGTDKEFTSEQTEAEKEKDKLLEFYKTHIHTAYNAKIFGKNRDIVKVLSKNINTGNEYTHYFKKGGRNLHNEDGPAYVEYNNLLNVKNKEEYHLNGTKYSKLEFDENIKLYDYYRKNLFGDISINIYGDLVEVENINTKSITWYKKGSLTIHRLEGPAIITKFTNGNVATEIWYEDGSYHNIYGPAYIAYNEDGKIIRSDFYVRGMNYTREDFYKNFGAINNIIEKPAIVPIAIAATQVVDKINSSDPNISEKDTSLKTVLKKDFNAAGIRVAANQSVKLMKKMIISNMNSDNVKIQAMREFLDSEVGESLISLALGFGTNYIPAIKDTEIGASLSKEFRVNGFAVAGNLLIDSIVESVVEALNKPADQVRFSAPKEEIEETAALQEAEEDVTSNDKQLTI